MAVRAIASFRLLLFAPLLGAEGLGALRLAQTATMIIGSLGGLGLATSYNRFLPTVQTQAGKRALFWRMFIPSMAGATIVGLVLLAMPSRLAGLVFSDPRLATLAVLVGVALPCSVALRSATGAAQGLGRFRDAAVIEGAQGLAFLLAGLAVLAIFRENPTALFGAYVATLAVFALLLLARVNLLGRPSTEKVPPELFSRALRYSLWYALIPITQYLFDFIDRWMIARTISLEKSGVYSMAPVLAGGMFLFGSALATLALQRGSGLRAEGRIADAERLVWSCAKIAALGSLAYALAIRVAEPLVWRLLGKEWSGAGVVLPLFLAYYSYYNVYYVVGAMAAFAEKTWVHLTAGVLGAAANIGLNLVFLPMWGLQGAALATLFGQFVLLGVHLFFVRRRGESIPTGGRIALCLPILSALPLTALLPVVLGGGLWVWKGRGLLDAGERAMIADFLQFRGRPA